MRGLSLTLSVVALCVALGGTGYALTRSSSGQQVIHACVNNKTGAVRIVGGHRACQRRHRGFPGEHALAWDKTGPGGLGDAYFSQSGTGLQDVAEVTVPPGHYIASGGCAGFRQRSDPNETAAEFGEMQGTLTSKGTPGNPYEGPSYTTFASVPDQGENGASAGGVDGSGSATLSNAGDFSTAYPTQIMEICEQKPSVTGRYQSTYDVRIASQWVDAIRVSSVHAP